MRHLLVALSLGMASAWATIPEAAAQNAPSPRAAPAKPGAAAMAPAMAAYREQRYGEARLLARPLAE